MFSCALRFVVWRWLLERLPITGSAYGIPLAILLRFATLCFDPFELAFEP
jgi:hypothetical protein